MRIRGRRLARVKVQRGDIDHHPDNGNGGRSSPPDADELADFGVAVGTADAEMKLERVDKVGYLFFGMLDTRLGSPPVNPWSETTDAFKSLETDLRVDGGIVPKPSRRRSASSRSRKSKRTSRVSGYSLAITRCFAQGPGNGR